MVLQEGTSIKERENRMKYTLYVEPYKKSQTTYTCRYSDFPIYDLLHIDKESYMCHSVIENSDEGWCVEGKLVHNLQVGRYCSLAEDVFFLMGRGKDYKHVSTSAAKVFHQLGETEKHQHREKGSIIIENDVWVGRKASFMSGVTVHNGAIVGAMSHVVHDVPPYAIVGGNPAKIIGYRFCDEVIRKLQTIQWWYWPEEKIEKYASYFYDIESFCEMFYEQAKLEVEEVKNKAKITNKDKYLFLVDYNDNYSTTPDVIDSFIQKYKNSENKELILYWIENDSEEAVGNLEMCREISKIVENKEEIRCKISLLEGTIQKIKEIMPDIKHFIINRRSETIQVMNYAEVYGKEIEIISGVDIPLQL